MKTLGSFLGEVLGLLAYRTLVLLCELLQFLGERFLGSWWRRMVWVTMALAMLVLVSFAGTALWTLLWIVLGSMRGISRIARVMCRYIRGDAPAQTVKRGT